MTHQTPYRVEYWSHEGEYHWECVESFSTLVEAEKLYNANCNEPGSLRWRLIKQEVFYEARQKDVVN